MRWAIGFLLALTAFVLTGVRANACTPPPWDFPRHLAGSKAVVHGRVSAVAAGGAKATLDVISYAGPGEAPAFIHLPETELLPGERTCPTRHLKFTSGGEYVVFLGDLPPNLRFADKFWTELVVDAKGEVHDNYHQTRSVPQLLAQFASEHGHTVQTPQSDAPRWRATERPSAWTIAGAGMLCVGALLLWRRWRPPQCVCASRN